MKNFLTVTIGMMIIMTSLTGYAMELPANLRAGVHGAYSEGGDLAGSEFGFGGQVEFSINDHLGVELAITHFSDEPVWRNDLDVTTVGLSAIGRAPLFDKINAYVLGGVNYNFLSLSSPFARDIDDDFGFHLGGGLGFEIAEQWELFTEYRYTFLSADVSTRWAKTSEDIDFGLFKLGVNYRF